MLLIRTEPAAQCLERPKATRGCPSANSQSAGRGRSSGNLRRYDPGPCRVVYQTHYYHICCLGEYFFTRYVTIRAALVDKGLDSLTNTDSVIGEKVCICCVYIYIITHCTLLPLQEIPNFEVGVNRDGDAQLETMLNELLKKTLKKEGEEDMVRRRAA